MRDPQVCLGSAFAFASYQFYATGTTTPANVYQDANLTTPFSPTGLVGSDAAGRFPPIYLDTSVTYAVQLTGNGAIRLTDPYVPLLATTGTSQLAATGMNIAPTGEITIPAPTNVGGNSAALTLTGNASGGPAILLGGTQVGVPVISVNNSVTTGAQTATFTATNKPGTATSSPAGWLPIFCDGTLYYTPIWHGNNFTPYSANPAAIGEVIVAATATFNGNGTTSVTGSGSSASPSSWYVPTQTGIGAGYYINITRTAPSNRPGLVFSSQGTWANITSGGIAITANGSAQLNGTYQLSSSVTGSPVVANGTIQLAGGNGAQDAVDYNGPSPCVLGGNGTATVNSVGASNWYLPTTASIGASYYINITRTSNSSGTTFTAADGVWTNITSGGLTIDISGGTGNLFANGNWAISNTNSSAGIIALGTIELTKSSNIQSPSWSGTTPLNLAGNGSATLNGVNTSSWYLPNTANVGSGYWIDITRTGGTSGVNFSAAQGSWTNITNSGLSIGLSGTSGNVGTVTASGNWKISSSSSGSPVLGSGTISLSLSGLTVIHVYTTGTNATETIPTGSSTAKAETWGGGGGAAGGRNSGNENAGSGGGAGGYALRSISVTGQAGHTFTYTVGPGGAGGAPGAPGSPGTNGSTSTINAGTVTGWTNLTANGGVAGGNGSQGGTASGGTTNTTGNAASGSSGGAGTAGNISGDGAPYGAGGTGVFASTGGSGQKGAAVFYYT